MSTLSSLLSYIFSPIPGKAFGFYYPLIVLIILLVAFAGFLFITVKKSKEDKTFKRLFRNYPAKLITVAACLGIYLLARYTAVPFLSMRVLLYVALIVLGILAYQIINLYLNKYPQEKKKHADLMEKNKYIPKKGSGK